MNKAISFLLMSFAASNVAFASPITISGAFEMNTIATDCNIGERGTFGDVLVKTEADRNSGIVGDCEIFKAIQNCASKRGEFTLDNVSSGSWHFPDYVIAFSCK